MQPYLPCHMKSFYSILSGRELLKVYGIYKKKLQKELCLNLSFVLPFKDVTIKNGLTESKTESSFPSNTCFFRDMYYLMRAAT